LRGITNATMFLRYKLITAVGSKGQPALKTCHLRKKPFNKKRILKHGGYVIRKMI